MSQDLSAAVLRYLRARQRLGGEGCWTVAQIARGFDIAEDAVEAVVLTLEAGGGLRTDPGTRFVMLTAAAPAPPEPALA